MPAIHPGRLKDSSSKLLGYSGQPEDFKRELHRMLSFYADRTYRPGQSGEPSPLLEAYKVRRPVLRQITIDLSSFGKSDPESALLLCDSLWEEPYLEFRLLAASLLGAISACPADQILARIKRWTTNEMDPQVIDIIFSNALAGIRSTDSESILDMVEEFLTDPDLQQQGLGIRGLVSLVKDPGFENIPLVYRLIQGVVLKTPPELQNDMIELLAVLAERSPNETAYFFRQNLSHPGNRDTARLIRKCLYAFPDDIQISLRNEIRGKK